MSKLSRWTRCSGGLVGLGGQGGQGDPGGPCCFGDQGGWLVGVVNMYFGDHLFVCMFSIFQIISDSR